MDKLQDEAISLIFIGRHITKHEIYSAFTGKDYGQRDNRDPANVTPENFDILVSVARKLQHAYLEDKILHYKPELDQMFNAYNKYDLESFKAAADSLLEKIIEEQR